MRVDWVIVAAAAVSYPAGAQIAQYPSWGVLSELGERDFISGGYSVAGRWIEPDRKFELHYLSPGIHYIQTIIKDESGALILTMRQGIDGAASPPEILQVRDGGALFLNSLNKLWMGREADGRLFSIGAKDRKVYFGALSAGHSMRNIWPNRLAKANSVTPTLGRCVRRWHRRRIRSAKAR